MHNPLLVVPLCGNESVAIDECPRTIADLHGADEIRTEHVTETIQYRILDRNLWA